MISLYECFLISIFMRCVDMTQFWYNHQQKNMLISVWLPFQSVKCSRHEVMNIKIISFVEIHHVKAYTLNFVRFMPRLLTLIPRLFLFCIHVHFFVFVCFVLHWPLENISHRCLAKKWWALNFFPPYPR